MPLGQRPGEKSESRYCGVETSFSDDVPNVLRDNLTNAFDFVLMPLTDPAYRPSEMKEGQNGPGVPPFAGSDLVLSPAQWNSHVVGKISSWIDFDSDDEVVRRDSETTLGQELAWAAHLSLQACLLPTPKGLSCANYARCVNQILQGFHNMQLWLRIPIGSESEESEDNPEKNDTFLKQDAVYRKQSSDPWEWWNTFRLLCEHHSQLSIALDILSSLPSPNSVGRWTGEPVRAAIVHTNAFLTNAHGYPCLSKRHQNLLTSFFNYSVQIVISGEGLHHSTAWSSENSQERNDCVVSEDGQTRKHPLQQYLDYIGYLYKRIEPLSEQERFELGYRDFLQAPLQPLMDNLEAQTYETFEKDTMKYVQYQKAVHAVLLDRVPEEKASTTTTVLMVVGAGRGPLVRSSLQAARETGRKLRIYAVEKIRDPTFQENHSMAAVNDAKNSVSIDKEGTHGDDMEQCEWNFGPSSAVMRKDMGGIRGMLNQLMSQLNPQGKSIIPLGHGDPSQFECYRPAKEVEDALVEAIRTRKYNGYAPGDGLPDSRRAVREYLSPGLPYKLAEDDVHLTGGCGPAMEVILAVLSRKDANILLPRPAYTLYDVLSAYNDIQARHYNLIPERDWEVDLEQVEAIADRNTVAIVLINPNNPCGVVFSHDHLAKLAETAKRLGLLIISDEAYSPMVFGDKPFVPMGLFATVVPVITLGSISKRWLVPGWRLGWIVTCDPHGILKHTQIKEAIGKLLNLVSDPATIAQGALPDILKNTPQEFYGQTLQMLAHAAEICYNRLQKLIVLSCQFKPQGSLFLMVKINISGFEDITDDVGFCTKLAKEESVIILPGSCLGMKNWMRICFAVSPSLLEEAFDRIESFCQRHAKST